MNYSDSAFELDDYNEDYLALNDHGLDVEPEWYFEQDLLSNCID